VIILRRQVDQIKTDLVARLKAEGVSYEERMNRLDEVTHPQPDADVIELAFERFVSVHPWVAAGMVKPKSIGREMLEDYSDFGDYIRQYGLQRSEGVLLRYLSQLYKTLEHNVPDWAKTEAVHDVIGFFRAMLERVDTSLIEEWESLLHPELRFQGITDGRVAHRLIAVERLLADPQALTSRIRAELHQLVRALSLGDWEGAAGLVRRVDADPGTHWSAEDFENALVPFLRDHERLVFDHSARLADKTRIVKTGERTWQATQILVDPAGDNLWCIESTVDLFDPEVLDGPLITIHRIGI
jgi:hypothetical protein